MGEYTAAMPAHHHPPRLITHRRTRALACDDSPRISARESLARVSRPRTSELCDQLLERLARGRVVAHVRLRGCNVEQCVRRLVAVRVFLQQLALRDDRPAIVATRVLRVADPVLRRSRQGLRGYALTNAPNPRSLPGSRRAGRDRERCRTRAARPRRRSNSGPAGAMQRRRWVARSPRAAGTQMPAAAARQPRARHQGGGAAAGAGAVSILRSRESRST